MTTQQSPDLATIKGRQKKAWSSGDYGEVGVTLLLMAELLAEAVDLKPGQRVLDVACGNASLAAARRFCEVVGIDYVPMLLDEGRRRADAEGLKVDFREGDAEDIPFPDASFGVVLSTLGVMFAPNQEKAAGELIRVCKPGVQTWWQDRDGQLGVRRLHRGSVQDHGQTRALTRRPEATLQVGHGGGLGRALGRGHRLAPDPPTQLCVALSIGAAPRRVHAQLLRSPPQGIRDAR